jgi:hypothetical protein
MATERGSLKSLKMVEVGDDELDAAGGGRGHGAYDEFVADFLEAGIRGTGVEFDGVQAQSVKTGLTGAIKRAVEAEKIGKDELQIRGKDGRVYLVRPNLQAS